MDQKLKGKVALITGGGRGIGKAVALAYAQEGARVAICARTASEIEQAAAEIRGRKAECEGWTCDVSSEESAKEMVAQVPKKFGRIDVLVTPTVPIPPPTHRGMKTCSAVFRTTSSMVTRLSVEAWMSRKTISSAPSRS